MSRMLGMLLLIAIQLNVKAQEVKISDSLWDEAMLHHSLEIQQKIYDLVLENQLKAFEHPDSEHPISPRDLKNIGDVTMHVAGGADDNSDTTLNIKFSQESFTGFGFNRQVNNDLKSATTSIQLDYISLLYTMKGKDLYFEETVLFYVSMTDLIAALSYDEISFIQLLDVMAKRLPSFTMTKSFKSYQSGKTINKNAYDTEQNVSMYDFVEQYSEGRSILFMSLSDYLSSNGTVYKTQKLKKTIPNANALDTVEVLLTGQNLFFQGEDLGDSLVMLYELNEETCQAYVSVNKTNQVVLRILPKPQREDMTISLRCKANEFYVPMSRLINSSTGETRVHLQTIVSYLSGRI